MSAPPAPRRSAVAATVPVRPTNSVMATAPEVRTASAVWKATTVLLVAIAAVAGGCADGTVVEDFEDVAINAEPVEGLAPLGVDFAVSFAPDGQDGVEPPEDTTYEWDFGDGVESEEAAPSHEYLEPGEFLVNVDVADGSDLSGSTQLTVTVTAWEFTAWQERANAICTETQEVAAQQDPGESGSIPDLEAGATLAAEEVERLNAIGLPAERDVEAQEWLDGLSGAAEMFRVFADTFSADSSDPQLVELNQQLDAAYASTAQQAGELGLGACAGDTEG